MLEQLNRINLLYDIYAPLLTERQREALRFYFSDNYSLGEIADEYAVSRQAVHDLIRRSLQSFEKWEQKLGLYARYNSQKRLLAEAGAVLKKPKPGEKDLDRLREIISDLQISNEQ